MEQAPQTVPRHPGSRTTITSPNLVQAFNRLARDVTKLATRRPPADLAFTTAADGVAVSSAVFAETHMALVVRSGATIVVELWVNAGAASVAEARLSVPDLALDGTAVATAGAGLQRLKVTLALPETWAAGDGQLVTVQARRASGADATTVRVVRAIHR